MQRVCAILCRHLWPLWIHHIFWHYLINSTIFRKTLLVIKCVFWFSLQILFEIYLILRRIQRHIIVNVETSLCKIPVIFSDLKEPLVFSTYFRKGRSNVKFNKNPSSGSRVVPCGQMDGQTERRMDMTKLIVAFRNFANAPENIKM
jgi:hypothetical protein